LLLILATLAVKLKEVIKLLFLTDSATCLDDGDYSSIYVKLAPHAAKWRDIGKELGFKEGEMNNIQSNLVLLTQTPPKSYLREMLSQWLQWAPGDKRGSTDFATRESLRVALLRANLGQLAFDQYFQDFHEESRGHAPHHSSQAEGRDQHTVNGITTCTVKFSILPPPSRISLPYIYLLKFLHKWFCLVYI
jgi:hypothetical protein